MLPMHRISGYGYREVESVKTILILLVCLSLIRTENHMEIWHTWSDTQTAISIEEDIP